MQGNHSGSTRAGVSKAVVNRRNRRLGLAVAGMLATLCGAEQMAAAAIRTFDGGASGTGTDLNNVANWSSDTRPGSGDEALFSTLAPAQLTTTGANQTYGNLVWDSNNTGAIGINTAGGASQTLTLNGNSNFAQAIASGGATGDLITLGTSMTSGTLTIGTNFAAGPGKLNITLGAVGNFNVLNAGATLEIAAGTTITGNGGITKTGAGSLILGGLATYRGDTVLSAGSLRIDQGNGIVNSALIVNTHGLTFGAGVGTLNIQGLAGTGSFALTDTGANAVTLRFGDDWVNRTFSGNLSGGGGLIKRGGGEQTMSGVNTSAGGLTISGGTIRSSQTSGTPFGAGSVSTGGTIELLPATISAGTDVSLTGATGAGNTFDIAGGANLVLNKGGNNSLTYTVGSGSGTVLTRSNFGTLVIHPGADINTLGVAGGESFVISGDAPTITNGMVAPYIVSRTAIGNSTGHFVTYGAGGFTSAAANYTDHASSFSTVATEIADVTGTATITDGGAGVHALRINGVTATLSGTVNNTGGGVIFNGGTIAGGTLTFGGGEGVIYTSGDGGVITSNITGSTNLTKFGAGRLTLGNSSRSFTGNIYVNGGELAYTNSNNLGTSTNDIFLNGGTLVMGGSITDTAVIAGPTTVAGRVLTISEGGGTLNTPGNVTLGASVASGFLTGSGRLIKTGSGTLTIMSSNTGFTGGTEIRQGTIQLGTNTGANVVRTDGLGGAGSWFYLGDTQGNSNATLTFKGAPNSTTLPAFNLVVQSGNTGVATIRLDTSSTAFINPMRIWLGSTNGAGHDLNVVGAGFAQTDFSSSITDPVGLTGAGGTVRISAGQDGGVTFSGTNDYSGDTYVTGGAINFGNNRGYGTGTLIFDGGNIRQYNNGAPVSQALIFNRDLAVISNFGLSVLSLGGSINLGTNSIGAGSEAARSVSLSGAMILSLNGVISNGTNGITNSLVKSGSGTITLGASNLYTGYTSVASGTLALGSGNNRLPTGTTLYLNQGAALNNAGARLDLAGRSQTIGGLVGVTGSGERPVLVNTSSTTNATLTVNTASNSTFNGQILHVHASATGNVGLTKQGAGELTLNAAHSMTGPVVVSGGTLIVEGGLASAAAPPNFTGVAFNGRSSSITVSDTTGLVVGQRISNSNFATGTYITSLTATTIGLSQITTNSGATSGQTVSVGAYSAAGLGLGSTVSVDSGGELRLASTAVLASTQTANVAGRLTGTGTAGHVNASSGGTIAPGVLNAGELNVAGNLTVGAGHLSLDLSKALAGSQPAASDYDRLDVTGAGATADLTGGDLVLNIGNGLENGDIFYVVTTANGTSGQFATLNGVATDLSGATNFFIGNMEFDISYVANDGGGFTGGNDVAIMAVSVPEPGSLSLVGLAGAGLLVRRRRNRKHVQGGL